MNGRIIAIGDIHGCHEEFADLLARLAFQPDDRLILLGDLVNRGPNSLAVIELARRHQAVSLLGNHELRLLEYRRSGDRQRLKPEDQQTLDQLGPQEWSYLEAMPLTHELPEMNLVFVHGGFLPGQPWQEQPAEVVTRIQVIDQDGRPQKRAECPGGRVWAELWEGPPFVVYGHLPRRDIHRRPWSVGIDTGCAMGGHLTAFILPERRFVQVRARRRYY